MFRFDEGSFFGLLAIIAITVVFIFAVYITLCLFGEKTFRGYYIETLKDSNKLCIYADIDNYPDRRIFCDDPRHVEEVLQIYSYLIYLDPVKDRVYYSKDYINNIPKELKKIPKRVVEKIEITFEQNKK